MKEWSRLKMAVVVAAGLVAAIAVLLAGGVYTAVAGGDDRVYVINRFTGSTAVLSDGVREPSLSPAAREERDAAQAAQEAEAAAAAKERHEWQSLHRMAIQLSTRAATLVGDSDTKLYHYLPAHTATALRHSEWDVAQGMPVPTGSLPLKVGRLVGEENWHAAMGVCPHLRSVSKPVYFVNELEAAKKGYWPCAECCPRTATRVMQGTSVREWPSSGARSTYYLRRDDSVTVLALYGDYCGIASERVDSGQRFMGWVSAQHVHVPKCGRCKGAGWLVSNGAATHVCTICRGSGRAASP